MNRTHVLKLLAGSKPVLAEQFGVTRLALFGSTARDAANDDSDIVFAPFAGIFGLIDNP